MKVVHINRPKIKKDQERADFAAILRAKWDEMGRRRAQKKYAALQEKQRTVGSIDLIDQGLIQ
jgi:hypothetical protein